MTVTIIIAVIATICVLGAGGAATEIGAWYHSLRKPGWKPPDWTFGPIWSVIGLLTCIAAVILWRSAATPAERITIPVLFAVNGAANILWSVMFFRRRRPDWALIEVVVLWLSVLALILACFPRAPLAAALLFPYLLWVSIASVLNLSIVRLNGPFGRDRTQGAAVARGNVNGQS